MTHEPTVFVVDDDPQARKSVCALVRSMGIEAEPFASAEEFLGGYRRGRPGCLVTDVRMFGMSGLELQDELLRRDVSVPVIVLTAYARTPLTVRAIRAGAITLLEKPYDDEDLWDAIRKGLARDAAGRAEQAQRQEILRRAASLTPAERRVMEMMTQGMPNKVIAAAQDVSLRTVENRRREVFAKMEAESVAQLVRMVIAAGIGG